MKYTITAGHGGGDNGASYSGYTEAQLMTELRDLVAVELRSDGHEVVEDGADSQNLGLRDAIKLSHGADCAVELHANASTSPASTGVEVIALPQHKTKAQKLAVAIARCLGLRLRGDGGWIGQSQSARGRLGFVDAGGMIAEVFFLSNPQDLSQYLANRAKVAKAIAVALS